MLSGYVLSVSESKRRQKLGDEAKDLNIVEYVYRRLEAIYPPYIFAIIASIVSEWRLKGNTSLALPGNVMVYCLLLQSWVPSILEQGLTYIVQCWFLSCLLLYWVIFPSADSVVYSISKPLLLTLVLTCSVGLPALYEISSVGQENWYAAHQYSSTTKGVDIAVLVLKFHPLTYVHIFILGCCLPRVREFLRGNFYY